MREALQFDPEVESEQDEGDYIEVHHHKHNKETENTVVSDDEFVQKKEKDRKGPRLLLDDALIMVPL